MLLLVKWGKQVTLICFENTKNKFHESQKFLGDKAYKGEAAIITSEETKEW